jgi:hypothetical protein
MNADVALADRGGLDGNDRRLIERAFVWLGRGFVGNHQHDAEYQEGDEEDAKPGTTFAFADGRSTSEGIRMHARFGTLHG